MNYRQLYAESCRKALEGFAFPPNLFERKTKPRKDRPPKNPDFRWTKEQAEQLLEYARQGLYAYEIAEKMNKTPKAIQKAFRRFGFPSFHNICPRFQSDYHGYVQEHRLVLEKHLGRFLLPTEVVHHIDGNHANNDISNLQLFSSNGEHLKATLRGVRHNMSAENRSKLSRLVKARWANGVYDSLRKRRAHHQ